jgi:hypothetical protein
MFRIFTDIEAAGGPQFAPIAVSANGATTVVAAVAGKVIRVLAYHWVGASAVGVKWQSHAGPTDLTGVVNPAANGGEVLPFSPIGWFQTLVGEALDINLSVGVVVGGSLVYVTL